MLQQEYESMLFNINQLSLSINNLFDQLDKLISTNNKNYTIKFKNKTFDFYPPTTKLEAKVMKRNRHKIIKLLLSYTFKNYTALMPIENPDVLSWMSCFDEILCFTRGADPRDHQFEKIDLKDIYKVADENGENITALSLDLDNYHVAMQDPDHPMYEDLELKFEIEAEKELKNDKSWPEDKR